MVKPHGPIPGENYTSDTKNYRWHRPPEFTDLDKAIDEIAKKLFDEESHGMIVLMQTGLDIATITDMFLTSGIGAGKWTPDFAVLLAGPTSHILYLMAKGYGLDPKLGLESKKPVMTKAFFDGFKVDKKAADKAAKEMTPELKNEVQQKVGGFMGMNKDQPEPSVTGEIE